MVCPPEQPDCGSTVLTPVDAAQDFGDAMHFCASPDVNLDGVTIEGVDRFAAFLFNVTAMTVTNSSFGDAAIGFRMKNKDAPVISGDVASEATEIAMPVPEKVLWGAPPVSY